MRAGQQTSFVRKKAVFFDRDGTLIEDKVYLNDPSQIVYLPGVFDCLRSLRDLGYEIFVVTNQSGIARGIVQIENLYETHARMRAEMARHGIDIRAFYYAPYSTNSYHHARKPNPGMLHYAEKDFGISLADSWMVGDRMSDVEAGHSAGCQSIFLSGSEEPVSNKYEKDFYLAENLTQVAQIIKSHS